MNPTGSPYHLFWGKTRQGDGDQTADWHAIAYHSLDVAAVAAVLVRDVRILKVDPEFVPLLLTLVAWHDIGKQPCCWRTA